MKPITSQGEISLEFSMDMLYPTDISVVDYSKFIRFTVKSAIDGSTRVIEPTKDKKRKLEE